MIYILYDDRTRNFAPEIEYGNGVTMPFKVGYVLFDEDAETKEGTSFWVNSDLEKIQINGDHYAIHHKFKNPIKAEIVFLRLKITEFEKAGFNFFLPKTYNSFLNKLKKLAEKYPEYII